MSTPDYLSDDKPELDDDELKPADDAPAQSAKGERSHEQMHREIADRQRQLSVESDDDDE